MRERERERERDLSDCHSNSAAVHHFPWAFFLLSKDIIPQYI